MEKNENIGLLYADYILIDEAGEKIGKRPNEGAFSSSLLKKGYNQIGLRLWRRDLLDAVKSMGGVVDTLFSQDGEIFDSSLRVGSDLGVLLKAERYCRQNGLRIRHYEGERVNGLFGSIVMNAPIVGAFCGSPYLAAYRQHPGADSHRFPHQQMETFAELAQRSNAVN